MNISFWGGCINRQKNIAAEDHYHAIVQHYLATETGTIIKPSFNFYSTFFELQEDIEVQMQGEKHFDYLILFLRPFAMLPLTKPIIRYTDKEFKSRLALHPRFTKRKYFQNMAKEYQVITQGETGSSYLYTAFQRLNNWAGEKFSLSAWT